LGNFQASDPSVFSNRADFSLFPGVDEQQLLAAIQCPDLRMYFTGIFVFQEWKGAMGIIIYHAGHLYKTIRNNRTGLSAVFLKPGEIYFLGYFLDDHFISRPASLHPLAFPDSKLWGLVHRTNQ